MSDRLWGRRRSGIGGNVSAGEAGQSIVEAVVSVALLTTFTVLVFPVFTASTVKVRQGSIKKLCQEMVNLKLNQYRYGIPIDVSGLPGASNLRNLTTGSFSSTSVSIAGAGALATGGFFYSKYRYNQFFPASCNGTSTASVLAGVPPIALDAPARFSSRLGMRECLTPNPGNGIPDAWDETGPAITCPATTDGAALGANNASIDTLLSRRVPGLKIYVRLELDTQWKLAVPAASPKYGQFHGQLPVPVVAPLNDNPCPNFGSWQPTSVVNYAANPPANALYDFGGAGDAIRVTVSGVIDFADPVAVPMGAVDIFKLREVMGGSLDPNQHFCTASAVVYPFRMPARYSISGQGRIYTLNGRAINNRDGAQQWILPSLYSTGGAAEANLYGGIKSVAVHPRDLSVYVLKRGSIERYSNCGGVPLDCSTQGAGISDDGTAARPSVQSWQLPNMDLSGLGVDFSSGRVVGLGSNRQRIYDITSNSGACVGNLSACTTCAVGVGCNAAVADVPDTDPLVPPAYLVGQAGLSARITGFFMAHSGEEAFVSSSSANQLFGVGGGANAAQSTAYGASIYRLRDSELQYPLMTLPVNAVSFSK